MWVLEVRVKKKKEYGALALNSVLLLSSLQLWSVKSGVSVPRFLTYETKRWEANSYYLLGATSDQESLQVQRRTEPQERGERVHESKSKAPIFDPILSLMHGAK